MTSPRAPIAIRTTRPSSPGCGAELGQLKTVAESVRRDRELDDVRAGRAHRPRPVGEIVRNGVEIVR